MISPNCQEKYIAKAILDKYNFDLLNPETQSVFDYDNVFFDEDIFITISKGSVSITHYNKNKTKVISVFDFKIEINYDDFSLINLDIEQTDEIIA